MDGQRAIIPEQECPNCGAELGRVHCIFICPNCGFKTDCSDLQ